MKQYLLNANSLSAGPRLLDGAFLFRAGHLRKYQAAAGGDGGDGHRLPHAGAAHHVPGRLGLHGPRAAVDTLGDIAGDDCDRGAAVR